MYCDNCGTENRDDARFCYKCRQNLSHIPAAAVATEPI
ncbi:MAG: zinc ribbon domain-containing protein, partial [Candidatus Hydrogenedentota bacterium]